MKYYRSHILVCVDPECVEKGAHAIMRQLEDELASQGLDEEVQVLETPRIGDCSNGPEIAVYPDAVHYSGLTVRDISPLVEEHLIKGRVVPRLLSDLREHTDEELRPPKPKEVRVTM